MTAPVIVRDPSPSHAAGIASPRAAKMHQTCVETLVRHGRRAPVLPPWVLARARARTHSVRLTPFAANTPCTVESRVSDPITRGNGLRRRRLCVAPAVTPVVPSGLAARGNTTRRTRGDAEHAQPTPGLERQNLSAHLRGVAADAPRKIKPAERSDTCLGPSPPVSHAPGTRLRPGLRTHHTATRKTAPTPHAPCHAADPGLPRPRPGPAAPAPVLRRHLLASTRLSTPAEQVARDGGLVRATLRHAMQQLGDATPPEVRARMARIGLA